MEGRLLALCVRIVRCGFPRGDLFTSEYPRDRAEYVRVNLNEPTLWDDSSASGDAANDAARIVHEFIRDLMHRYRALRDAPGAVDAETADQRLAELYLAEAALRYAREKCPPQAVVMGPTQTGKSTLVNLLLGRRVAEVSPLAGFTIHPRGFWVSDGPTAGDEPAQEWEKALFPGWRRCSSTELSRSPDDLEQYALTRLELGTSPASMPAGVVWDTPDFDSLAARRYQRGVLEAAALADAHVFVLSKEKYADLSVWRMLQLLKPLGRPLTVCLNKLTPDAGDALAASLKERLREMGGPYENAPIVTIAYESGPGLSVESCPEAARLREQVVAGRTASRGSNRWSGIRRLARLHWDDWTAPLRGELAALAEWETLVRAALDEASASYKRDFLDHPQRFDTFRRATLELLQLLELPGLAGTISQVRHVLSWPARKLFAARQAWQIKRSKVGGAPRGPGAEEIVLNELIEKLLTSLERDAARRSDTTTPSGAVWRMIARRLEQQSTGLKKKLETAADKQRDSFKPVIHESADKLYEALRKKPALLNALRAARATTDLAAIGLAIKTAGLGINDLLFAPAMFALTSMLAEGALGTYMAHISADLKKRQLAHVNTTLFEGVFAEALRGLAVDLDGDALFAVSEKRLRGAELALAEWERRTDE